MCIYFLSSASLDCSLSPSTKKKQCKMTEEDTICFLILSLIQLKFIFCLVLTFFFLLYMFWKKDLIFPLEKNSSFYNLESQFTRFAYLGVLTLDLPLLKLHVYSVVLVPYAINAFGLYSYILIVRGKKLEKRKFKDEVDVCVRKDPFLDHIWNRSLFYFRTLEYLLNHYAT